MVVNAARFDFGPFVVFINTHTASSGSIYGHWHDDLLTYEIYKLGVPICVDPGRTRYGDGSTQMAATSHNGLWAIPSLGKPLTRFFTPPELFRAATDINASVTENRVVLEARNAQTDWLKRVEIEWINHVLYFKESIESRTKLRHVGLTHCLPLGHIDHCDECSFKFCNLLFRYELPFTSRRASRASSYGNVEPASNIFVRLDSTSTTSWSLHHAAE